MNTKDKTIKELTSKVNNLQRQIQDRDNTISRLSVENKTVNKYFKQVAEKEDLPQTEFFKDEDIIEQEEDLLIKGEEKGKALWSKEVKTGWK